MESESHICISPGLNIDAIPIPDTIKDYVNKLTPRQWHIIERCVQGATIKVIAAELQVGLSTVEIERSRIRKILTAKTMNGVCYEYGLIGIPSPLSSLCHPPAKAITKAQRKMKRRDRKGGLPEECREPYICIGPGLSIDDIPIPITFEQLTSREQYIVFLGVQGKKTSSIAQRLSITAKTVENARSEIQRKLGVKSMSEVYYMCGLQKVSFAVFSIDITPEKAMARYVRT